MSATNHNNAADLILSRVVDVPPALVWTAWTVPKHLEQWYCPRPYGARVVEMDVRPGGAFHCLILDPKGDVMEDIPGCYLEVVDKERLSFTSALTAGYRPVNGSSGFPFLFTAIITFEAVNGGSCRYTVRALHGDEADARKHADMGFHDGWGTALDQLVAYAKAHLAE